MATLNAAITYDLLKSLNNSEKFLNSYKKFRFILLESPLWLHSNPIAIRIPWNRYKEARVAFLAAFDSPGLHIWGSKENLISIGMTTKPLWMRLTQRYFKGDKTQCELAAVYSNSIIKKGINGFPKKIREWSKDQKMDDRLQHTIEFAKRGIDSIWFTILPVNDSKKIKPLKKKLISVSNSWNSRRGYDQIINR